VDLLPGVCERLADGELATDWHHQILVHTHDFTDAEMGLVDEEVAVWDLAMTPEDFTRELKKLVTRILARRALPPDLAPENQRRVEALPPRDDGTGCVRVTGPIPEMLAYMRRLDQAARAVQQAQQQAFQARVDAALADGDVDPASIPVPFDPDRTVAETGRPLSLAQIRERLVLTARFDTDGVPVPAARFRINVTIPALTLLGADDEPGMLDGTIPIPAAMAKDLAAGEPTWYRVLTDPSDGEFLPLPADRYQPTAAMREHLRLRHSTCTVPGCGRPVRDGVEFDHIDEYDRTGQGDGGATEVENLHGLCMVHHGMKTGRVIDPTRAGSDESPSGVPGIWWELSDQIRWFTQDHTDLATTDTATAYENAWRKHRECRERHEHAHDTTSGTTTSRHHARFGGSPLVSRVEATRAPVRPAGPTTRAPVRMARMVPMAGLIGSDPHPSDPPIAHRHPRIARVPGPTPGTGPAACPGCVGRDRDSSIRATVPGPTPGGGSGLLAVLDPNRGVPGQLRRYSASRPDGGGFPVRAVVAMQVQTGST
jgi:hypothetical protein